MNNKRIIVNHESKVPNLKKIGIIGGFSQWGTLDIIERILRYAVINIPQYGNRGYPQMDIRFVNKAPMKLNPDGNYPENLEPSNEILEAIKFIETNTDFIIIPSNTPHLFIKQFQELTQKPILNIIDLTIEEVKRRKIKKIGVMAIGITLKKRLFQNPLSQLGIEIIELPDSIAKRLESDGIDPIQEGATIEELGNIGEKSINYFRQQKVDAIILGCTELPILLNKFENDQDIINPSQLLAKATIEKCF